jgi:hypothetical protein
MNTATVVRRTLASLAALSIAVGCSTAVDDGSATTSEPIVVVNACAFDPLDTDDDEDPDEMAPSPPDEKCVDVGKNAAGDDCNDCPKPPPPVDRVDCAKCKEVPRGRKGNWQDPATKKWWQCLPQKPHAECVPKASNNNDATHIHHYRYSYNQKPFPDCVCRLHTTHKHECSPGNPKC